MKWFIVIFTIVVTANSKVVPPHDGVHHSTDEHASLDGGSSTTRPSGIRPILSNPTRIIFLKLYLLKKQRLQFFDQVVLWEMCHDFYTNYYASGYNVKEKFRAILEFTIDPNTGACKKELDIPLMVCSVLLCNSSVNHHDRIRLLIESLKGSLEYLYKTFADELIGI